MSYTLAGIGYACLAIDYAKAEAVDASSEVSYALAETGYAS